MSAGNYTIPMSEYYQKSKDFKGKVKEVADDVERNFIKRVSNNIGSLDSKDQAFLESASSYTSAKKLLGKLNDTHGRNLGYMSSENANNPLWNVVNQDMEFAKRFNDIAQGKISGEVASSIRTLDRHISLKKSEGSFLAFAKTTDKITTENEWLKRISKAGGFEKFLENLVSGKNKYGLMSFEKLLFDPTVGKAMVHSKRAEKFLEFWMDLPYDIKNMKRFSKGTEWVAKAGKYLGNTKLVTGILGNNKLKSAVGFGKKIIKNETAQKFLKVGGKTVVWGVILADVGYSGYKNWTSEDTNSKTTAGKVGKAIVGTAIDQIKNVGPLNGMWAGAKIGMRAGGVGGAAAGLITGGVFGAINQIGQFVAPNYYDKGIKWLKDTSFKGIDFLESKAIEIGKGLKKSVKQVKSVGKNIATIFTGGAKVATSWFG